MLGDGSEGCWRAQVTLERREPGGERVVRLSTQRLAPLALLQCRCSRGSRRETPTQVGVLLVPEL